MKLTICRLDASFFLTERTISWIMQSMLSFEENVSPFDLKKAKLGASTAYAYYARAAYDSSKNASNLFFEFDKKYIFKPERDKVKGMENPNTLSSWCRLMGFLYDDDGVFSMGEFAKKFVANNYLNTKELCLAILAKQWVVVDGECKRSLLSVLYELKENADFLKDLSLFSSNNNQENKDRRDKLQKAFFKQVVGRVMNNNDEIQFTRFDALRNTLLLAGIMSSNMNGDVFISTTGTNILKDFHIHEDRLSKYNPSKVDNKEKDFHKYMSSTKTGIFEIIKEDNISVYKPYTNLIEKRNFVLFEKGYAKLPLQKIYYGAPGTGKSNEIKILTGEGKDGIVFSKNYTFRTTFHPDFDYSSFVGAYKPIWDNVKEKIVYDFRPQTFLKAYVAAWTHPSENVALVIEEINRGNCAQIFGDIFQLLDRENNGMSKYPIESDVDMKDFLSSALSGEIEEPWTGTIPEDDKDGINEYYSKHYDDAFAKIKSGEILTLPKNLSILATMNTSDQSLFPMDSAFKRRWEWQYMPIVSANKDWKIQLHKDYENIDWWEFLERINNVISDLTTSEDKQLGYFFCQPDDFVSPDHASDAEKDLISAKHFVDKVIFYLWNDVFKDYAFDAKCCKDKDGKEVLFAKFYNEDGKSVNFETLNHFFESLTVDNKPSLVKEIVPTSDASGEEDANVTDATSVNEEPSSTGNESVEAESSTTATTDE